MPRKLRSKQDDSLSLSKARELVRAQQALHHSLVQLQERAKGLMPRRLRDEALQAGRIDHAEYLTLALACGVTEDQARDDLRCTHRAAGGDPNGLPPWELIEPDLPQYSGPTRIARRPPKGGNTLRGHPLD